MTVAPHTLSVAGVGTVRLTIDDRGEGRTVLLLHGGAGPQSVAGFADLLATTREARVITPTHPGFGGTSRPDGLSSIAGLAALYAELIVHLDLSGVIVVGNSIGGWIAAELALLTPSQIGRLVLVNAVGIDVPGHPVADISSLSLDEVMNLSYYDPEPFRVDPSTMPEAARAALAGNRTALAVYAGSSMTHAGLAPRLGEITVPALVVWGEADQIVDPDYGRAYAAAVPGAAFRLLPKTGHVPQIETPSQLLDVVWEFADSDATF
jgi:pimeloyl-ACP methyl ester carboxylesterase